MEPLPDFENATEVSNSSSSSSTNAGFPFPFEFQLTPAPPQSQLQISTASFIGDGMPSSSSSVATSSTLQLPVPQFTLRKPSAYDPRQAIASAITTKASSVASRNASIVLIDTPSGYVEAPATATSSSPSPVVEHRPVSGGYSVDSAPSLASAPQPHPYHQKPPLTPNRLLSRASLCLQGLETVVSSSAPATTATTSSQPDSSRLSAHWQQSARLQLPPHLQPQQQQQPPTPQNQREYLRDIQLGCQPGSGSNTSIILSKQSSMYSYGPALSYVLTPSSGARSIFCPSASASTLDRIASSVDAGLSREPSLPLTPSHFTQSVSQSHLLGCAPPPIAISEDHYRRSPGLQPIPATLSSVSTSVSSGLPAGSGVADATLATSSSNTSAAAIANAAAIAAAAFLASASASTSSGMACPETPSSVHSLTSPDSETAPALPGTGLDVRSLDPIRYKTSMCRNLERTGVCAYGDVCVYAHNPKELRSVNENVLAVERVAKLAEQLHARMGPISLNSLGPVRYRKKKNKKNKHGAGGGQGSPEGSPSQSPRQSPRGKGKGKAPLAPLGPTSGASSSSSQPPPVDTPTGSTASTGSDV